MATILDQAPARAATAGAPAAARPRPRIDPVWGRVTALVLATRLAFLAVAAGGSWLLAGGTGQPTDSVLALWNRWDAGLFVRIAEHGYFGPGSDPNDIAFFPLVPMVVRALAALGVQPTLAGMLLSTVSCVVAGVYLWRLAEAEVGEGAGRRAAAYLLVFPTAVFLVAPYTEATFLAGVLPAVYYARRREWASVAPWAAIAAASRLAGGFLLAALAVELLAQRGLDRRARLTGAGSIAIGSLPLLGYCAFLYRFTGDPIAFVAAQERGWGRVFTNPLDSYRLTLGGSLNGGAPTNWMFFFRIEIVAAALMVALIAYVLWRREWAYALYMALPTFVLLTSTWYYSVPRVLLTYFPVYLLLARATAGGTARHERLLLVLAPLATLGVLTFTRSGWLG